MPIEKEKARIVDVVDVRRQGAELIIPASMTLESAVDVLQRQMTYEEETVVIREAINAFPWDGALALAKAMQKTFGWATAEPTPGWFGENPPTMMAVEVAAGRTQQVVWGRFRVPGIEGYLQCGVTEKNGRQIFELIASVKRKFERIVAELAQETRRLLSTESIYRGQAIRMRFRDDQGKLLEIPEPSFIDLSQVREDEIVFSKDVEEAIRTNLFTPLERAADCRANGVPLKRGILLAGPYGTGKSLAALVSAKKAVTHGWTYIYIDRADDLERAIRFAYQYGPAVVFTEDIDKVISGERDIETNAILNIIDGIESKDTEIMVVLTTNHVEDINQALLRPGRLDAVINVQAPDAEAAARLVRLYGRHTIDPNEDLTAVGRSLAHKIPAVIRECVERAKLAAVALTRPGGEVRVNSAALLNAAKTMEMQLRLLEPKAQDHRSSLEKLGDAIGRHICRAIVEAKRAGADLDAVAGVAD